MFSRIFRTSSQIFCLKVWSIVRPCCPCRKANFRVSAFIEALILCLSIHKSNAFISYYQCFTDILSILPFSNLLKHIQAEFPLFMHQNGGHADDDRHCREHQCGYFQMQFLVLQYALSLGLFSLKGYTALRVCGATALFSLYPSGFSVTPSSSSSCAGSLSFVSGESSIHSSWLLSTRARV